MLFGGGLYKKSTLQGLQFATDLSVGEDTLFFANILKRVRKVSYVNEPLYCYVQFPESAAHGKLNKKKFDEVVARELLCELFADENRKFLYGARAGLAMTAKHLLTEMYEQEYIDEKWQKKLIALMRKNLDAVTASNYSTKAKIAIIMCAFIPKIYLKLR